MADGKASRADRVLTVILWISIVLLVVLIVSALPVWVAYFVAPLLGVMTARHWTKRRTGRRQPDE